MGGSLGNAGWEVRLLGLTDCLFGGEREFVCQGGEECEGKEKCDWMGMRAGVTLLPSWVYR